MALTKEELDNIKLPLSEEDYRMLRLEDARTSYNVWKLASPELRAAFDKKEAERVDYNIPKTRRFLDHTTGIIVGVGTSRLEQLCDIRENSNDNKHDK